MFSKQILKNFFSAPVVQYAPQLIFLDGKNNSISFILGSNNLLRNTVWSTIGLFFPLKWETNFTFLLHAILIHSVLCKYTHFAVIEKDQL